jgi:hypothetical protein
VAQLASSIGYAAQQCGEALNSWEAEFLSLTGTERRTSAIATPDSYRRLAEVPHLLAPIRAWTKN